MSPVDHDSDYWTGNQDFSFPLFWIRSSYAAKGVEINNPIQPTQLPRGYGGVAVLWNKNIDSYVKPLPDGNERLQCIEFGQQSGVKLLIISAYFPTSSGKECKMEFQDIIDQLHEIYQKYHETHEIIIGGDLNEDLSNQNCSSKIREYLRNFISECNLKYCISGKNFYKLKWQRVLGD